MPTGSASSLSDPAAVMPSFLVDLAGTYVARLTVNDRTLDSPPDDVTITTQNSPPVADAGPDQTVFVGDVVTLNGGGSSDVDGDPLSFSWIFISVPGGSTTTLSDPTAVLPTFAVDLAGTYVVQLIVNDGLVDSVAETVAITTQNSPPIADAGEDQSVLVTDMVQLDGSGSSDVDGDLLSFNWSFTSIPEGSLAVFSDTAEVMPSFIVDLPGTYVSQLVVNDNLVDSVPDTITVVTQNSRPVADAGPDQTVFVTDAVQLDGSDSSDVDGDLLTFRWSLTNRPLGSDATLSDSSAVMPTFVVDTPGTYVAQLIVKDDTLDSAPDTVTIITQNSTPVANAGPDQTAFVTDIIQLDGSGSIDVDDDILSFAWSLSAIPEGSTATLSDVAAVMPTFAMDVPGTYVAQLIVNDGILDSAPDTLVISSQNSRPVANAGPPQVVFVEDLVILDGSGSTDVDGDPLSFSWAFTSKPVGSSATLSEPASVAPAFTADLPGTYVAQLIVNDGIVNSAPDTLVITTANSPPVADAGPDQAAFINDTVKLDGRGSSDPDNDGLSFFWTYKMGRLGQ